MCWEGELSYLKWRGSAERVSPPWPVGQSWTISAGMLNTQREHERLRNTLDYSPCHETFRNLPLASLRRWHQDPGTLP